MADAWTIFKENSTLESGDAWELLNTQAGGSGEPEIVYRTAGGGGTSTKYIDKKLPTVRLKKLHKEDDEIKIILKDIK